MEAFDLKKWKAFEKCYSTQEGSFIIDQIAIDSRRIESKNSLFVALKGQKEDGHHFLKEAIQAGAKCAIVSKEFEASEIDPSKLIRVDDPLKALQEIAAAYRETLKVKVIGITGSFGKTMVKDLLFRLLQTKYKTAASPESFNSQIGVPLSLLQIHQSDEFAIIEAGISKEREIDSLSWMIRPTYSILTPVGKKHLSTLKTEEKLLSELTKFISTTPIKGWSLLPSEHSVDLKAPVYFWDKQEGNLPFCMPHEKGYEVRFPCGGRYVKQSMHRSPHLLNLFNMAIKAAWLLGVSKESTIDVLFSYEPEGARTEIWKSQKGVTLINTPYSADPQSVLQALHHLDYLDENSRKIVVFGGMQREERQSPSDYKCLAKAFSKYCLRYLILVGKKSFKELIEEFELHSPATEVTSFESYEEAFPYLLNHVLEGDFILFKGDKKLKLDLLIEKFNESTPHNQCTINLAAIRENLNLIRSKMRASTRIMVMVKALAYGTDDRRMAHFLRDEKIDILGVSFVDEAVSLKMSGVRQAIFVLHAAPYESAKAVRWDLEVGVAEEEGIKSLSLEAAAQNKSVRVHLHVNTGMGRFGCRPQEALKLAKLILSLPGLSLEGIMTHFSCADDPKEDAFTLAQAALFDKTIEAIEKEGIALKWKHAANSSAALRFDFSQYNMARIGLSIYGLYPSKAVMDKINLRLALSLVSRIVAIDHHEEGDAISYGRSYIVEGGRKKIAVLPIGYFDGLHRHYSAASVVLVHGKEAPMVGNICMDYMMVDVSAISEAKVGDPVLIYGEDESGHYLSPEELAKKGNSIAYELMTCLGPRIPRIFIYEESKQIR